MNDDILEALGRERRRQEAQLDADDVPAALVRPLEPDERASVLDAAFARLDAEPDADDDWDDDWDDDAHDEPAEDDDRADDPPIAAESTPAPSTRSNVESATDSDVDDGRVVALDRARRRRSSAIAIAATLTAVAAAVLLWWSLPDRNTTPESIAALPPYAITHLAAGPSTHRAVDETVPDHVELPPDGAIELILTPTTPTREPVAVALVARPAEGPPTLVRLSDGVQTSDNGGVQLQGPLDRFVSLAPGEWTLTWLVGSPSTLPATLAAWRDAPDPPPWRVLVVHATITAPPR